MLRISCHPSTCIIDHLVEPQAVVASGRQFAHDHRIRQNVVETGPCLRVDLRKPVTVVHLNASRQLMAVDGDGLRFCSKSPKFLIVIDFPFPTMVLHGRGADAAVRFAFRRQFGRHAAADMDMPVRQHDAALPAGRHQHVEDRRPRIDRRNLLPFANGVNQ